jgi:hypothetical protein
VDELDEKNGVEYDGSRFTFIAQMCSAMSVYWMMEPKLGEYMFKNLDLELQAEIAVIVLKRNTPDLQFDFAKERFPGGFEVIEPDLIKELITSDARNLKVILYGIKHVSALVKQENGNFIYYEPETGKATEIKSAELNLYLEKCAQAYFLL